jgi:pimeloyl-ACP methyl ester carboxylesterase
MIGSGSRILVLVKNLVQIFANAFHHPRVVELSSCGHVPQEEEGSEILQRMQQFLSLPIGAMS